MMVPSAGLKAVVAAARARGKTVVQYYVYTDPGSVPLGAGWIVDSMSKDSLPKTLEALRARAAR